MRTLIHGEPYIERQSKEAALYWRQRKQADSDMKNVGFIFASIFKFELIDLVFAQGNYVAAASHYRHALCALGRTVPVSKIDVVACVVWNCWRQVLHRIGMTRFLSGRVGRFFISRDERRVAREFLAEAAICFHKLHQLHLSQKDIVDANSHYG